MAIKLIHTCLAALLMSCAVGVAATPASAESGATLSQGQILKNYALTACLGDGLAPFSQELKADAADVEGVYLSQISFDMRAYKSVVELGLRFLEKSIPNRDGKKLTIMKCINFYQSAELDQLVKRFENERIARLKKAR